MSKNGEATMAAFLVGEMKVSSRMRTLLSFFFSWFCSIIKG